MKIVNLKAFRKMLIGTIAMKFEPCVFGSIFTKGETWEHDFLLEYLTDQIDSNSSDDMIDKLYSAKDKGTSVAMSFDETMRDGMFEETQLFAVWEKEDIQGLIHKLEWCLEKAYNK